MLISQLLKHYHRVMEKNTFRCVNKRNVLHHADGNRRGLHKKSSFMKKNEKTPISIPYVRYGMLT